MGLSFVTMGFHNTARFSFAIFQVPLIEEFGWGRGALGGAYALMLGIYALGSPFMGAILDKHGPRAVIPWGSLFVGGGLVLGTLIGELWHVYLFTGVLIGAGTSMSGFALHSALMPRWFQRRRGLATGIALSGSGIGLLLLSPAIERLIAHAGWRQTYLVFGLVVLLVIFPVMWLLLRNAPGDVGQGRDGLPPAAAPAKAPPRAAPRMREVFRELRGDRRFWALLAIIFFIGLNNNTVFSQLQLYLVDAGFGTAAAAVIFGAVGAIRMVGSMVIGALSDAIGRPRAQALSASITAAGIVILMLIPAAGGSLLMGALFVLVYGIGIGGMGTCHSAMSADAFGGPSFGAVIGILELFFGLGGFLGPPLAGLIFDATGSYLVPFGAILAGIVTAAFIALFVCRPSEGAGAGLRTAG